MPIPYDNTSVPTCYATCSIGHDPSHTLPVKLKAIADAGFDAIELSMPDVVSYGKLLLGHEPDATDYDSLVFVGREIKSLLAREHGGRLRILMLQPFANLEGWVAGSGERRDALDRAAGWLRVMDAVGTDMLQVGSSDAPASSLASASMDRLAADLAELADLCAARGFRVAYENWCWASRAPGWKQVWEMVRRADRPNLGLCLDTFQSAGGEWADPTTPSGLVEEDGEGSGPSGRVGVERRWRDSLADLAATVPADKIFLLQISDAYRMEPPLEDKVDEESGLRPRARWSHDYRPLPFDGGYLPVRDFVDAVLATGFRGYLSIEVFDAAGQARVPDLGEYARKAMRALERLLDG